MAKDNDVGTGSTAGIYAGTVYEHSFGNYANHTQYFDPPALKSWSGGDMDVSLAVDLRPELKDLIKIGMERMQVKALTTEAGGAGTAGFALVPIFPDSRIVDRTRKYTPWVELIGRVTNQGLFADFNIISDKAAAITAFEDAPLTDQTDTEDRVSKAIKFLYAIGRVTGPMQAGMPSYIIEGLNPVGDGIRNTTFGSPTAPNAKQYEVLKKSRSLRELEENLIWNGNTSTDATQYNGIVADQSTTNQNDKTATAFGFDDIENTVVLAYDDSGRPNMAAADSSTTKDIRKTMIDQFRYRPGDLPGVAGFGVPAPIVLETMVGPTPLVPSQFLTTTSGAKQLWFLDMEFIEMRVLQDMTFQDMAINNDSNKFMLKIYETILLRAPQFNAFVDNIA